MRKRLTLSALLCVAVVGGGWYFFRPELRFIDKTVNEALPDAVAAPASLTAGIPLVSSPGLLKSGRFHSLAHETTGTAGLYQTTEGSRLLHLADFKTSNGPDLRVYLVAGSDGANDELIRDGSFIDLGALKGNIGAQNYELPGNADLMRYRSVSIWCRRLGVSFGAASLNLTVSQ